MHLFLNLIFLLQSCTIICPSQPFISLLCDEADHLAQVVEVVQFCKVVWQQIWGEVYASPRLSVQFSSECNNEWMDKAYWIWSIKTQCGLYYSNERLRDAWLLSARDVDLWLWPRPRFRHWGSVTHWWINSWTVTAVRWSASLPSWRVSRLQSLLNEFSTRSWRSPRHRLSHEVIHDSVPRYLEPLSPVADLHDQWDVRSAHTDRLVVPSVWQLTTCCRAFPLAAPQIWNTLTESVVRHSNMRTSFETVFVWVWLCEWVSSFLMAQQHN